MNKKVRNLLMAFMISVALQYPRSGQTEPAQDSILTTTKSSKSKKKPSQIGACSKNFMSMYKGLWVEVPHKAKGLKNSDQDEGLINLNLETLMLQYCRRKYIRVTRQ